MKMFLWIAVLVLSMTGAAYAGGSKKSAPKKDKVVKKETTKDKGASKESKYDLRVSSGSGAESYKVERSGSPSSKSTSSDFFEKNNEKRKVVQIPQPKKKTK